MNTEGVCAHCGLSVRIPKARSADFIPYCCLGCRLAASVASGPDKERRFLEARLLLAAVLAMGVMSFSLVFYGEAIYAPGADAETAAMRRFGLLFLAFFSLPVFVLLAPPILRGAILDFRARRLRMDGLILMATTAAYALSIANTFRGEGPLYYETAVVVLVLIVFGRRLEAHARREVHDAIQALKMLLPNEAQRLDADGREERVRISELQPKDRVAVKPGAASPADLLILEGASAISAAHLTGEELERPVRPGDTVPAGAVNGRFALIGEVIALSDSGSFGRIRSLLEAPLPLTKTQRRVDGLASLLAAVSIALAILGGVRSYQLGGLGPALTTALSVLLVACPCALGLAIPLAYRALHTALAKARILVHDPRALELLPRATTILLDKTGTLTDPTTAQVRTYVGTEAQTDRMQALVRHSGHALGAAVVSSLRNPTALELIPGEGVVATIDGKMARAGRLPWILDNSEEIPIELQSTLDAASEDGGSLVAYAEDGALSAVATVTQQVRPHARTAMAHLARRGLRPTVLSGDRKESVHRLASELSIDGQGELRPEDKVFRVKQLQAQGEVVIMTGDGVNDAGALRAADVSIALACGTAVARSQAQIEILGDDLRDLVRVIEGAEALRRVVTGNLIWTLAYNAVALALATLGLLTPLISVAVMILSSLAVSYRSFRLLSWKAAPC